MATRTKKPERRPHQTEEAHSGGAIEAREGNNRDAARVSRKRGAKHSHKAEDAEDVLALARKALAQVGATEDDLRVQQVAEFYKNAEARCQQVAEGKPWRDIEAIEQALRGVELTTDHGAAIREVLFEALSRCHVGLLLKNTAGSTSGRTSLGARKQRRRPFAVDIEETLRFANERFGWGCKECAAAVFVATAPACPRYESLDKSFGDVAKRVAKLKQTIADFLARIEVRER